LSVVVLGVFAVGAASATGAAAAMHTNNNVRIFIM
jgi:hypothetical protein